MKKYYILLLLLAITITTTETFAQTDGVGIGIVSPDPTSILHIQPPAGVGRGLLIPRLTTSERLGISSPAQGLLVFDTNLNEFCFYNSGWFTLNELSRAAGSTTVSHTGNISVTGTVSSTALSAGSASLSGQINMNSNLITNVANGVSAGDAVNKSQLDTKADKVLTTVTGSATTPNSGQSITLVTIPRTANKSLAITARLTARYVSGGCCTGDSSFEMRSFHFKDIGGTATFAGSTTVFSHIGASGAPMLNWSINGSNILITTQAGSGLIYDCKVIVDYSEI